MKGERPFTAYVGGYCGGKWGCTTFVESTPQGASFPLETTNRRKWGGLWYANASAWHDLLFLVGGADLTIQQMSESAQAVGLCSIYSAKSTLDPFRSGIHFIGAYGVYLTESRKITSMNFANLRFPKQGPGVQHQTGEPLAIASEDKFVYVIDQNTLTVYETRWAQTTQQGYTEEESHAMAQLTQVAWEKRCVEDEVKLADDREVEALLAIHNSLGGANWHYTGQIGAGKSSQDYLHLGPWPIASVTQDGKMLQLSAPAKPCSWYGVTCSCEGHVTELSLSLRNVQGAVPPEIRYLTHLEKLSLSYTGGKVSLPSEISELKNLRYLDAMYGPTPNAEAKALPNICIITSDGATGAGCDAQLNQAPKPGCTYP